MPSTINEKRRQRGLRAIASHPDFHSGIDLETAASDLIADILHAVFDTKPMKYWDDGSDSPQDLLDRALRSYEGDAEDDEDA